MPYSKLQLARQYFKYLADNQGLAKIFAKKTPTELRPFMNAVLENTDEQINSAFFEDLKLELKRNLNKIQYKDLGSGEERMQTISSIYSRSSKREKHLNFLFRLTKFLKPKSSVEIGTSLGLSTLTMSMGHPGKIYTFEGIAPIAEIARENFSKALMDNIELIEGNFNDTLPSFFKNTEPIEFYFIDGNHYYEPTLQYFEMALEKSINKTVMVFDDINWSEEMQEAWKNIKNHPSSVLTIDLFYLGIVFLDDQYGSGHYSYLI